MTIPWSKPCYNTVRPLLKIQKPRAGDRIELQSFSRWDTSNKSDVYQKPNEMFSNSNFNVCNIFKHSDTLKKVIQ